jgi:hypothetical protein
MEGNAERLEKARRYVVDEERLRLPVSMKRHPPPPDRHDVLECRYGFRNLPGFDVGDEAEKGLRGSALHPDEAIRLAEGERSKVDGVEKAEES